MILDFGVTVLEPAEPRGRRRRRRGAWVPLDEVAELRLVDGLAEFLHEHGILDVIT